MIVLLLRIWLGTISRFPSGPLPARVRLKVAEICTGTIPYEAETRGSWHLGRSYARLYWDAGIVLGE